jgi:NADP-dependent 3-hydroxy acid dehydrogenase YdfG
MKVAIVTGGTRGIGRAILEKFLQNSFFVISCGRNKSQLEQVQTELALKYPRGKILFFQADLSQKHEILNFAHFIKSQTNSIDILVNNSGLYIPGQVHNEAEGNLELMIHTNLYSAYYITRELAPIMISAKQGHIFNMCSVASITPYVNGGSYCISKFALLGMGKVLREEMKPNGIRVTNILPGATKTDSWAGVDLPDERFIHVNDIADIVWSAYNLSKSAVVEDIVIRPQLGDI